MKTKFTKKQKAKIAVLMKKYGIDRHEAARMYVRSGL